MTLLRTSCYQNELSPWISHLGTGSLVDVEALEAAANDILLLMVRNVKLHAVCILPHGLGLREVWAKHSSVTLHEDGWVRWCGDVGVVDTLDEVTGSSGGGAAELWLVGDIEVEVEEIGRRRLLDRHHSVRNIGVGKIGIGIGPSSLVDSTLGWWEGEVGSPILILVCVANGVVARSHSVSVFFECCNRARGGG